MAIALHPRLHAPTVRPRPRPTTRPGRRPSPIGQPKRTPRGTTRPATRTLSHPARTAARANARRRLYVTVATTVTFLCLFGVAGAQVLITQGQFELARLQRDSSEAQSRYDRLRLRVAELESPAHVVATAQRRLGMVPPATVTYLSPAPVARGGRARATASTPGESSGPVAWQELKPHLSGSSTSQPSTTEDDRNRSQSTEQTEQTKP